MPEDSGWTVSLRSVCGVLAQVVPHLDLDAVRQLIGKRSGDHVVIYSDDSDAPELSLELILFEDTSDYLHIGIALSKEGTSSVSSPTSTSVIIHRSAPPEQNSR